MLIELPSDNGPRFLHDWRKGLAGQDQWQTGFSAIAAAQSWQQGFPTEVRRLLGEEAILRLVMPEHKVPMPGRGHASQCDVFALVEKGAQKIALAVEAKVNEPFGQTLDQWLAGGSANKVARLETICNWLGVANPDRKLRYQLFHRTAAAIAEARRLEYPVAAMIVQSFSPTRRWFADFAAFCRLFGGDAVPDRAIETVLPCGLILRLGWACGDPRHLKQHMTCLCDNQDCECK